MNEAARSITSAQATNTSVDVREIRPHSERLLEQATRLKSVVQTARQQPYYKGAYEGVDAVETHADLIKLPILRKNDLVEIQPKNPPFGGIMSGSSEIDYLFVSPGPIHEPGFTNPQFWRADRAMRAAGFEQGDIVHNTFSYHLTPGAWILDAAARAIGCPIIPAGNAPIEQQIIAIYQYGASAYAGTPDFLKTLIEACQAADRGPLPFKKGLVSGGALTPGLRSFFEKSGVNVLQCYATAELGLIGYEASPTGQMIIDEDVIVEIVDPTTGEHMPFGAVGEVVVTTLREDYPLIRFGTGDLSCFVESTNEGGRTSPVLAGWLGRADQAAKVRGMFIRPSQIDALCNQVDGLNKARLIIDRENEKDDIMLFCEWNHEMSGAQSVNAQHEIESTFRELCHLKTKISFVENGSLADDGKTIVDMRP